MNLDYITIAMLAYSAYFFIFWFYGNGIRANSKAWKIYGCGWSIPWIILTLGNFMRLKRAYCIQKSPWIPEDKDRGFLDFCKNLRTKSEYVILLENKLAGRSVLAAMLWAIIITTSFFTLQGYQDTLFRLIAAHTLLSIPPVVFFLRNSDSSYVPHAYSSSFMLNDIDPISTVYISRAQRGMQVIDGRPVYVFINEFKDHPTVTEEVRSTIINGQEIFSYSGIYAFNQNDTDLQVLDSLGLNNSRIMITDEMYQYLERVFAFVNEKMPVEFLHKMKEVHAVKNDEDENNGQEIPINEEAVKKDQAKEDTENKGEVTSSEEPSSSEKENSAKSTSTNTKKTKVKSSKSTPTMKTPKQTTLIKGVKEKLQRKDESEKNSQKSASDNLEMDDDFLGTDTMSIGDIGTDTMSIGDIQPTSDETTTIGDIPSIGDETTTIGDIPSIGDETTTIGDIPSIGDETTAIGDIPSIGDSTTNVKKPATKKTNSTQNENTKTIANRRTKQNSGKRNSNSTTLRRGDDLEKRNSNSRQAKTSTSSKNPPEGEKQSSATPPSKTLNRTKEKSPNIPPQAIKLDNIQENNEDLSREAALQKEIKKNKTSKNQHFDNAKRLNNKENKNNQEGS